MTVIDGATNAASTVTVAGSGLTHLAVNRATNKIYVTKGGDTVTVIDGATNATSTVTAGGGPVAVNEVTNKIYVISGGGRLEGD